MGSFIGGPRRVWGVLVLVYIFHKILLLVECIFIVRGSFSCPKPPHYERTSVVRFV